MKKSKIYIPNIKPNPAPETDNRFIILQHNSHEGLNIAQAMFLKVVLESWINSQLKRE